jgi:hypothetical protein
VSLNKTKKPLLAVEFPTVAWANTNILELALSVVMSLTIHCSPVVDVILSSGLVDDTEFTTVEEFWI